MHQSDFKSLKKALTVFIWFVQSSLSIPLIFILYLTLILVQLVNWMRGNQPFGKTEPYLFLGYLYEKLTAFPSEKIPPYSEWKNKDNTPKLSQ